MDNTKFLDAILLAVKYHADQTRKSSSEPYVMHPLRVAKKVSQYTDNLDIICSAVLHDTLEDTKITEQEIENSTNSRVLSIVKELTNDTADTVYITRGKAKYLSSKLSTMSDEALLVKLCDRYDNTRDLNRLDDNFASKYKIETTTILNNLLDEESGYYRELNKTQRTIINKILENICP